jgi:alanine-synthesizing transaminase
MDEFPRITRLPPYVFNITGDLKMAARRRGEDIIDFGMGNPDQPTPPHIVDKMIETARRGDTHRYSVSKGIPRLRKAICNWYKTRYNVDFDPEKEAIAPSAPRRASPTWPWRRWTGATSCWCRTPATRSTSTGR